jgi:SAM-dependent methyltransferase
MMVASNNLEEYADPELYDLENSRFEPDGPFFLELARQVGGAVLEIGCGTGRITIPLAQQGVDMTGLDIVPQMIERAQEKARGLPIHWVTADARAFSLERPFRLIFESGAAFQHLLTRADQEKFLACVRAHLEPDGRLLIGSIVPTAALMETDETEKAWFSYPNSAGQEVRVSGTQHYDPLRQIKTETAVRRWQRPDGEEAQRIAPLMLRYTFPQELETLLHYNGFTIVERYGDWDRSSLASDSKYMIFICQQSR